MSPVMKRFAGWLAAMAFVVALPFAASAQRTIEPKFYVGAKGGVTFSKMDLNPHAQQTMKQGITMGIVTRYTEEKIFGLMAELLLEQRGWKEGFDPGVNFDYRRTFTYITLPVMTHIYFGGRKFKGFVNLGPSISYMISSGITADFDYENPASVPGFPIQYRNVEQMMLPVHRKFDYGILGGIGMEFIVGGRHSFMLEGRYYFGLGNVFSDRKRDPFQASRNMTISAALTYLFRVK